MSKITTIDWDRVGKMLMAGNGAPSIARALGISDQTLYRRCQKDLKIAFVDFRAQKLQEGNDALLTKGYTMAVKGDRTMLIFYLKNRCGFADRQVIDHSLPEDVTKAWNSLLSRLVIPEK
ncbi:MAG TPA: helix-turn-helix domain-containing protein [Candidatus Cloacimonadota bacterium]|nr:helix-turn-helix domain-containing protein [Candidatus Cloacimonadota bacterium]